MSTDTSISKMKVMSSYPFGMLMPERSFSSPAYRYGFNGMEKDDEMKGDGNSYDFGARIYDARLGRWLSIDPSYFNYPEQSPYNFAHNNSIIQIDPDGRDPIDPRTGTPFKINLINSVVVSNNYDPLIHHANKDDVLNGRASSWFNRTFGKHDDNLGPGGGIDADLPNVDRSANLISNSAAIILNEKYNITKEYAQSDPPNIQSLSKPTQYNNWKKVSESGYYTFIDDGYAEYGAWAFYRNKTEFNIITVQDNEISEIVNMKRNGKGEYDINYETTFKVQKGKVQTRVTTDFFGRETQERYRNVTITESTIHYKDNKESGKVETTTYQREEIIE